MVAAAILKLDEIKYVDVPANFLLDALNIFPTLEKSRRITEPPILVGAISIAFIASAETLLCATAVDQMHSGPRTKYDQELSAQGIGNALCGVLGVLPMTGVIVRSGANVEAGAKTRGFRHSAWCLVVGRSSASLPWTATSYHPAVGAGRRARLHRLQARLPEDLADADEVRLGRGGDLCRHHRHHRDDRTC